MAKRNLNPYQDWASARVCSAVMLTNDGNSVERKLTTLTVVNDCYLMATKWGKSDQVR